MYPHSWQGQEPQHRIYPALPWGQRGSGHTQELSLLLRDDGCPEWAAPGQLWTPVVMRVCGEHCTSHAGLTSCPGLPELPEGPSRPSGEGSGLRKTARSSPAGFGVAGGRRQAPGPHLNWGLLTRVRRAAVKAATSPCSRAEPGPAMSCLRERGGGRRRRQAGQGCRMAGGELEAVGRPASPGRPRGGSQHSPLLGKPGRQRWGWRPGCRGSGGKERGDSEA